jgi:hypothetical protein
VVAEGLACPRFLKRERFPLRSSKEITFDTRVFAEENKGVLQVIETMSAMKLSISNGITLYDLPDQEDTADSVGV